MLIKVFICLMLFVATFVKADTDSILISCVYDGIAPKNKLKIEYEFEGYDIPETIKDEVLRDFCELNVGDDNSYAQDEIDMQFQNADKLKTVNELD